MGDIQEATVVEQHDLVIRRAVAGDVARVRAFGVEHVPPHYAPLIGAEAAERQVTLWWQTEQIAAAVSDGAIHLAEVDGRVVGVVEHGQHGGDVVIWKLYLDPAHRGGGIGPRLVAAVIAALPTEVRRVGVEHFAGNVRAAAFYEREGFVVDRVERNADGVAELDVVWRALTLERPA